VFAREELGLPVEGFVFCCFNNTYKITPEVFDIWMRLLQAVPASVLWLLADSPTATANLHGNAAERGVDPRRVLFAPRRPLDEHLARQRAADLFLDTWPCNAHTTASDALWAGLPVLTRAGRSFASRVGASLLNAIGLPQLVTDGAQAYENLALRLAGDPEELGALRRQLASNRLSAPLFDTARTTQDLEAAYRAVYERDQAGLPPQDLRVMARPPGSAISPATLFSG
jgi:protein O-GlcNAc transferase